MRHASLGFYHALSRLLPGSYVGKLLTVALVGAQLPVLCLLAYVTIDSDFVNLHWGILIIAFATVLSGVVLTAHALKRLIAPLVLSSRALRDYVADGRLPTLPTEYKDTAGLLMRDVQHAITEIEELSQETGKSAMSDFLTGAYSRRAGTEMLESDIARALRGEGEFSLAFMDLDNLKQINDQHGHAFGDRCLKQLVDTVSAGLRKGDWMARWGGDEFVLLLWNVDMRAAADVMLRIDKIFDEQTITARGGKQVRLHLSVGICKYRRELDSEALLLCADRALYRAKTGTNSGVVMSDGERFTRIR